MRDRNCCIFSEGGINLPEVILYSTGCPRCSVLKHKLDAHGILYSEVNDMDAMLAKGFRSTPMLEIGERTMDFTEAVKYLNELKP